MEISPTELRYFQTVSGSCPFKDWLDSLDSSEQVMIDVRLTRLRLGSLGDHRHLGAGLFEARLHAGPGYRLYFGRDGKTLIILLQGGDKKSQSSDIKKAHSYWLDYLRRTKK